MLISLFAVMSMAVNAEVIEYSNTDDFKYKLDTEKKNAELSKYSGSATEVVVPASVTYNDVSFTVTSLGDKCFHLCRSLTSVTIPSSVTSLGKYCFYGCRNLPSHIESDIIQRFGEKVFECTLFDFK